MARQEEYVVGSNIEIKIAGTALADEVMDHVLDVMVDQHSHLPHMFTIRLYDPHLTLLDSGPFDLAKEVEVVAEMGDSATVSLVKGEITALEPNFGEGMVCELVVRGYDKSHRLFRESKSAAFLNIKDSDLASQIAGQVGLSPQVDATSTVYDHIYQDNQTDLAFLMQRAWRIGYECFVADGKLYFRKPPASGEKVSLAWGEDLVSFSPRMTLAEQVDEVIVKGWDVDRQEAIVGQAKKGKLYPKIGESKNGDAWARTFGTGKMVVVDQPVVSQAEANVMAQARLDEISGTFVEAEGFAYRRPDITAGKHVEIANLGERLSGTYLVTQATHIFSVDGYHSTFTVRGSRNGLLAEQMNRERPLKRWTGVVTAVVTNTDDPNDWGRVKVKYPWMTDDAESDWARVLGNGAGPEAGLYIIPDVNDEVMVAFEQGDFNQPIVLGGVWNGKNAIPAAAAGAAAGEKPLVRTWHSRTGHLLAMYDNADNKVEIITAGGHSATFDDAKKNVIVQTSGGHKVSIDDQIKKVEIKSSGGHTITLDDNGRKITVQSGGDVEVKAAANIKLQAGANVELQGVAVKLSGTSVDISGASVSLSAPIIKLN